MALIHDFLAHETLGKLILKVMENFIRRHGPKLAPFVVTQLHHPYQRTENPNTLIPKSLYKLKKANTIAK